MTRLEYPRPPFIVALLLALLASIAFSAKARGDPPNPHDVRGCLCFYSSASGKFSFNAFIKTADKEPLGADGAPEILGFNVEPGNLDRIHPRDEHGMIYPVNVRADIWIPADGKAHEVPAGRMKREVRCPPYWSNPPNIGADR